MNDQAFLTSDEAATALKLTKRTLQRLIRTGRLPATKIGSQWRVRSSDLDALFSSQNGV